MLFRSGDMPSNLCKASLNGAGNGIESKDGANYFSLYAKDITGSYSMWSFLGSLKMEFASPIDVSEFHDPYITFYWNSDDNIGSFQLSISQGEAIGGSTFSPGKTDKTYDPDAKYDLYTLRPTNKQWHCITARLKDLIVENWGGDFKALTEMLKAGKVLEGEIRFFAGYSGWTDSQLENELQENSWMVGTIPTDTLFTIPNEGLWEQAMSSLGGRYKLWANFPEDPILN